LLVADLDNNGGSGSVDAMTKKDAYHEGNVAVRADLAYPDESSKFKLVDKARGPLLVLT